MPLKHTIPVIFVFLLVLLSGGCSSVPSQEPISTTAFCFDTVVTITLWESDDQEILDQCVQLCQDYEQMLSRTIEGSEVYQINHAGGQPVTVSDDTAEIIRMGLKYGDISNGRFDITIAPLSILWNFKENDGTIPEQSAIDEARSHVDYRNVEVSGNTVTLKDPEAAIDLGGIAKGYIADRLKEFLQENGIEHATINLGGNVLTIGEKPDGAPFRIGIQKPFDELNATITTLEVRDQSVVTSGIYERYFEKDGKIYHHILDPETGYPYENHLFGVTILSDMSVDGDALSTTCLAMGLEEGLAFINQTEGVEAIFITDDYELHYSDGLEPESDVR